MYWDFHTGFYCSACKTVNTIPYCDECNTILNNDTKIPISYVSNETADKVYNRERIQRKYGEGKRGRPPEGPFKYINAIPL